MGLQNSGRISLKEIGDEFGETAPYLLSEMYGKGGVTSSGKIQVGNFYGKSSAVGMAASEGEGYHADDGYTYWLITQSRNFEVASGGPVEVCLVGGGASGHWSECTGTSSNSDKKWLGGGGGKVTTSSINLSAGSHPITLGAGASPGSYYGSNGGTTSAFGLTASGGRKSTGYSLAEGAAGNNNWQGVQWPASSGCWLGQAGSGSSGYYAYWSSHSSQDGKFNFGYGGASSDEQGGQQYNYKGYEGCVIVRAPTPAGKNAFGPVSNLIKRFQIAPMIKYWGSELSPFTTTNSGVVQGMDENGFIYHFFENSGTIDFGSAGSIDTAVEVFLIGAGGAFGNGYHGGGYDFPYGGGGAGGCLRFRDITQGNVSITVGASAGGKGGDSSINMNGTTLYAYGGGEAGITGGDGGSGGGSQWGTPGQVSQGSNPSDLYTDTSNYDHAYGNIGAQGVNTSFYGGGGGAGSAGSGYHGGLGIAWPKESSYLWAPGGSGWYMQNGSTSGSMIKPGTMSRVGHDSHGAGGTRIYNSNGHSGLCILRYKVHQNNMTVFGD